MNRPLRFVYRLNTMIRNFFGGMLIQLLIEPVLLTLKASGGGFLATLGSLGYGALVLGGVVVLHDTVVHHKCEDLSLVASTLGGMYTTHVLLRL